MDSPESAVLIDLCEKVRKFRTLTAREDEKVKALVAEAIASIRSEERRRAAGIAEKEEQAASAKYEAHQDYSDEGFRERAELIGRMCAGESIAAAILADSDKG